MNSVELKVSDRMMSITLNRVEKRNALNPELISELNAAFNQAKVNEEVKVVILKANGTVFSAGADLAYLQQLQTNSPEEHIADLNALKELFWNIYTFPKLTIAQVEGHAIAGGCGLLSVCDFVFAVPEAQFGYTEVKIGFIPALVSCFLVGKIGETRTKELLLSGQLIDAQTALQYNLINFVVERDVIEKKVLAYTQKLVSETSGASVAATKELLIQNQLPELQERLNRAVEMNAKIRGTEDFRKGIAAFLAKEQPKW